MKTYSFKTLKELYRVDNKYWKTGDTDLLDKRTNLAKAINERFTFEITAIVSIATRSHLPVNAVVEALYPLGFVARRDDEAETD